jgi:hypothetical protein
MGPCTNALQQGRTVSEPVHEVHERAKRLAMSLTMANRIRATDVLARFSRLRARRRQRVSHASVRSTIQRFGSTTKPVAPARRLTMRRRQPPLRRAAVAARGPRYLASAKRARMNGNSARVRRSSTSAAPSRSWMLAACTMMVSSSPSVSTRTWYLTPLTFLPASKPTGSTDGPPFPPP